MAVFTLTFLIMVYAVIPFDEMGLPCPLWAGGSRSSPPCSWWRCRHRPHRPDERGGAGRDLCGRLRGSSGRGVYHRHQPGHHCADERRRHHRHGPPLGRAGPSPAPGPSASRCWCSPCTAPHHPDPFLVGLATLSIPIVAPLGKFAGVGGDLVVTAFQSASGLVNIITPTAAVVMGALALGHVPYDRWVKYVEADTLVFAAGPGVPGGGCAAGIEKAKRARFSVRAFFAISKCRKMAVPAAD